MKVAIGIDIGGTAIKYGLVGVDGSVFWSSERPTRAKSSRKEVESNILSAAKEAQQAAKSLKLKVNSVGVGTPGLVNNQNLVLGGADNIVNWVNVPLGELVRNHLDLPTFVANDADMMAMGEFVLNKEGKDTIIYITLGTGIGGAIFVNGELFQGHNGLGGELGVFPMIVNDRVLNWEDVASTSALIKMYKDRCKDEQLKPKINGKYILKKYHEDELLAKDVISVFTEFVAMGLAGYVNVFNPKKIIIGGGISAAGEFFIEKIKLGVEKFAIKECYKDVEILAAKLENNAGFIGAGIYANKKLINGGN